MFNELFRNLKHSIRELRSPNLVTPPKDTNEPSSESRPTSSVLPTPKLDIFYMVRDNPEECMSWDEISNHNNYTREENTIFISELVSRGLLEERPHTENPDETIVCVPSEIITRTS